MKFFIPTIGTRLRLTADWKFPLLREARNRLYMLKVLRLGRWDPLPVEAWHTLPAGSVLKVDRLYIRQGLPDFDSVTFRVEGETNSRFWVPLSNANEIEYEIP